MSESNRSVEFVGFWYRLGALLWDLALLAVIAGVLLGVVLGESMGKPHAQPLARLLVLELALGYFLISWILVGRSVGKWLCSQQIVSFRTGAKPGLGQCLLRMLTWPTVLLGVFFLLRDRYRRTLHDRLAGTCVIADASMRRPQTVEDDALKIHYEPAPWRPAQ